MRGIDLRCWEGELLWAKKYREKRNPEGTEVGWSTEGTEIARRGGAQASKIGVQESCARY